MGERIGGSLKAVLTLVLVLFVGWAALELTGNDDESVQTRSASQATAVPTATPEPTKTPTELKGEAEYLDPRRLAADPNGHLGDNIIVQGNARDVAQKDGGTWLRLDAGVRGRPLTEALVVELRPPNPDILREECFRFYGIAAGTERGVIRIGGPLDPLVDAYAVEPSPREGSFCKAP